MPGLLNLARRGMRSEPFTGLLQAMKAFLCKVRATFHRKKSNANSEESPLELVAATRPERDHESRILTGTLTTIQNATTTEDAVSRLARRHLAMPRISVGNPAMDSQVRFPRVLNADAYLDFRHRVFVKYSATSQLSQKPRDTS